MGAVDDGAGESAGESVGESVGWRMSAPTVALVIVLPIVVMGAWVGEVSRDPIDGTAGEGYRAIVADMCAAA